MESVIQTFSAIAFIIILAIIMYLVNSLMDD